ncbi:MAG: MarR family transcriptional regulator [Bacillota bacterium]|nr:MarR family transcriptional regulator [Bacillota bacterium]MDP4172291.1 MarR family transcriptional regulator [Bacillota bacterium]
MTHSCSDESAILYKLHSLNKQISSTFEGCTGISQSRLDILHQLYEVEEISQTALQKEINIDSAAVTRHLKQLEANGMVSRRKSQTDNRITLVRLTDHGRHKIISFREEKARFVTQMLDGFSEEERALLGSMLNRIQANLKLV